jgi:ribonuclease P protein subunit POP4
MWSGYIWEVLGLSSKEGGGDGGSGKVVSAQNHGPLLASLDYHGAEVEVVRCGCVDGVGIKGIVVRDTKFTFVIVTKGDEVKSMSPYLPVFPLNEAFW